MKQTQHHHFFLHDPTGVCQGKTQGTTITLEAPLSTRIATILRLRAGETCTLFSGSTATTLELTSVTSGKGARITAIITAAAQHAPLQPAITLVCGITKQATFEEICYTATQLGVSYIIPIITAKSYTKPYSTKEMERFAAHSIAAAEQSKQIILPTLHAPQTLDAFATKLPASTSLRMMFEADGTPFRAMLAQEISDVVVAFGPEGGFTEHEQALLASRGFIKTQLCKPILRTQDAVEVGLGLIRCLL